MTLKIGLFAAERLSIDTVAPTVLATLLALQIVTSAPAVSGLSHPPTVTVGALFVISAGLHKSGAPRAPGRFLIQFACAALAS